MKIAWRELALVFVVIGLCYAVADIIHERVFTTTSGVPLYLLDGKHNREVQQLEDELLRRKQNRIYPARVAGLF